MIDINGNELKVFDNVILNITSLENYILIIGKIIKIDEDVCVIEHEKDGISRYYGRNSYQVFKYIDNNNFKLEDAYKKRVLKGYLSLSMTKFIDLLIYCIEDGKYDD